MRQSKTKEFFFCAITAAVSFFAAFYVLKLWNADLSVLIDPGQGATMFGVQVKNFADGGSLYQYANLAAPYGTEGGPLLSNTLVSAILMLCARLAGNYALVCNIFMLATFPLTALTAFYALRQFKVSHLLAAMGAVLYSLLPLHFIGLQNQYSMACYFLVPLLAVLIYKLLANPNLVSADTAEKSTKTLWGMDRSFTIFGLAVCILTGLGDISYFIFACIFLLFTFLYRWVNQKSFRAAVPALLFLAACAVGFALSLIPWLAVGGAGGGDLTASSPAAIAQNGLQLSELLLPVGGHRLDAFASLSASSGISTPFSLGIVLAVGLVVSIVAVLFKKAQADSPVLLLGKLNLFAILFAGVGGISLLAGFLTGFHFVSYNRITAYVAFFSAAVLVLVLEQFRAKIKSGKMMALFLAIVVAMGLFGIYDQTTTAWMRDYNAMKQADEQMDGYVASIEETASEGAGVFVLSSNYSNPDLYHPYLHSEALKWSIGGTPGSVAAAYQETTSQKSVPEMLYSLAASEFSGLLVDRMSYSPDDLARLEAEISTMTGAAPMNDAAGKFGYFDLSSYTKNVRGMFTESEWEEFVNELDTTPVTVSFQGNIQNVSNDSFQMNGDAQIVLNNPSDQTRDIQFGFGFSTADGNPHEVYITSEGFTEMLPASAELFPYLVPMELPPGDTVVSLSTAPGYLLDVMGVRVV